VPVSERLLKACIWPKSPHFLRPKPDLLPSQAGSYNCLPFALVPHSKQGTYRFDVDIPECPRKPYASFLVRVERNAAPPPPVPLPPPPPFVNHMRVTFTTRFELADFDALAGQHAAIRQQFIALLVCV
jgi:hypothetical protein